ncbi:efflux RND transporter periplasmic adaptor subunit [Hyphomicrobium facile]|uniref:efflux RND transporter periplasmic adaptor subunit n=1 Tax=Hyphomicrobium facile TaxID=51670 RepID=UPI001FCCF33C|nr:efflux RND transporter periplasmic adaptor subunit [Hyphomicrobium facile]
MRSLVKTFIWLVFLAGLAGGGYWVWQHHRAETRTVEKNPDERVPVTVATAETRNFPVYFDSLGTAQAWNMVTVRSRVDGEITKVAFDEGQFVKAGDLLIQIDPRPYQAALDQAVAKKAQDEANLANLKRDLQRFEKVGTLATTQQQIDTQRSNITQQESLLKADAGAIANTEVQVVYTTIKAPISGRVGFRLVDQGNIIHAGDTGGVATIAQIQPIAVIFTEPEERLPRILDELKHGPLSVTAFTSDGKQELAKGQLSLVDNQVDTTTGSIKLKGRFPNTEMTLWPGLTVATRLLITTEKNVVVIPDAAVQRGPDKMFAYVVGPGRKAERRDLVVGEIQDGQAVIKSGVKAGEQVVTAGYYRLEPGSTVELPDDRKKEEQKQKATPPGGPVSESKHTVLEAE